MSARHNPRWQDLYLKLDVRRASMQQSGTPQGTALPGILFHSTDVAVDTSCMWTSFENCFQGNAVILSWLPEQECTVGCVLQPLEQVGYHRDEFSKTTPTTIYPQEPTIENP